MKRILTILAIALAIAIEAEAQSVRLGDRIPDMQLDRELAITSKEYVCLSFVHTESAPCLLAIETLCRIVSDYTDHIEIVFVSNQEDEVTEDIVCLANDVDISIFNDKESHAFKAFGIKHVPYTVIYSTKRNRVEWFGSVQQLNEETIERIINKKK